MSVEWEHYDFIEHIKVGGRRLKLAFNDWMPRRATSLQVNCSELWSEDVVQQSLEIYYRQRGWGEPLFKLEKSLGNYRYYRVERPEESTTKTTMR